MIIEQKVDQSKVPIVMKTIGVIGGIGPQATMDFEARIHKVSQNLIPQHVNAGYPPMVVYYLRHAPILLGETNTGDHIKPDPRLLEVSAKLGPLCDFLVLPSNTPHFFQKQIEAASGREVLSMVSATLEKVRKLKLERVGVLAVGHALRNGLYQERLTRLGIPWETIPDKMTAKLDESIWSLMEGRENDKSREVVWEAVNYLRSKSVDGIILGCTELPLLLKCDDDAFLINPAQILAEAAVKYAIYDLPSPTEVKLK